MTDFAAVDFETANQYPSSVCSVCIVIVRNGQITEKIYRLIRSEPEWYSYWNTQIHGLTSEDTADADVFPNIWAEIAPKIAGLPLVVHCGYDLRNHHHALADAEACAMIAMEII
jgi:DNA polymerase-3 subunit epsilon